jgi:sugar/nucleoside kinase (ribokinase family)
MKPIVVGSINMDLVSQTERIPQPGEKVIEAQLSICARAAKKLTKLSQPRGLAIHPSC